MNLVVVDYDPQWPKQFAHLRGELWSAVSGLAKTIEPVGSTAVPGLSAKPIIDIDIVTELPGQLTLQFIRSVLARSARSL